MRVGRSACAGAAVAVLLALPAAGAHANAAAVSCPNQDLIVGGSDLPQAKTALLCLLNAVRAQYGLAPLSETAALDNEAKQHPGTAPQPPPDGFSAGLVDPAGSRTAYAAVAWLMATRISCSQILSPSSAPQAGVSLALQPRLLSGPSPGGTTYAYAPSWALDLAGAETGTTQPNFHPANSCPHPLPRDGAGQGGAPHAPPLSFAYAVGDQQAGTITLQAACPSAKHGPLCKATAQLTVLGGKHLSGHSLAIRFLRHRDRTLNQDGLLTFHVDKSALRRALAQRHPSVTLLVNQAVPSEALSLWRVGLYRG